MTETPDVLRREIKVLTFDQYGTIVDMQKGLTEAVTPFLEWKGWHGNSNNFVTWWRRKHFENSMIDALCDRGHTRTDRSGIARSHMSWIASVFPTRRRK